MKEKLNFLLVYFKNMGIYLNEYKKGIDSW